LRKKDIGVPQFGDDRFRCLLLPWHVPILLDALRHTSSRTTSMGADHCSLNGRAHVFGILLGYRVKSYGRG
jgi:hypothetical protein